MGLRTFAELAVRLGRKPFSLADRPYLWDVYRCTARNLVIRASRQVEKSTFLANRILFDAYRTPGIQILFVCPRNEQGDLFSTARLAPVILESPVLRRRLWPYQRPMPVRDIKFSNGSRVFIRAAFRSADSCRGISADRLFIDEFQDAAPGSLEVLKETMSHSRRATTILTGTPKMLENQLEGMFKRSTANEWHVTCPACNQDTIMNEQVIGESSIICPACRGPVVPQSGSWVPRNPHSQWGDGFTINHLMVPWLDIHDILDRQRTYDRARFVNEVLGLSTVLGDHIVTREEVEACCENRPFAQTIEDVPPAARPRLIAGIDWGGGSISGTVLVLGYMATDIHFRVVRFDRWLPHAEPHEILQQIVALCKRFRVRCFAADGGGQGSVYNRLLLRALGEKGGSSHQLFSMYYSSETQPLAQDGALTRWTINRTQSIGALFSRIKARLISFPQVEECGAFLDEFVCELVDFDPEMRTAKYTKPETERDDALHATVYAESIGLRMAATWA